MVGILSLSENASKLKPEEAFIYLAKALELKKKGVDVISFGIGQPDFQAPKHVIEAAKKALDEGYSGYGPSLGLSELREAIKDFVNESYGVDVKLDEIMVTVGAKTAVFMGLIALINPGDEVLIPDPGYPLYESAVLFAGGKPVFICLDENEEYRMKPEMIEEVITPRTRVIVLNYPENPVGSTLSKSDVEEIMEIAARNNIAVFSDEIYDRYVYDGEHYSTLQYEGWRENLYYVNGFSKTFAITGWRLGYVITNKNLIEKLDVIANNIYSCPVTFAQKAMADALREGLEWFKPIWREFKERRDLIYNELSPITGIKTVRPRGSFYIFPNIKELESQLGFSNCIEFSEKLLYDKGVLALPGTAFPGEGGKHHLRFSFAVSKAKIKEGTKRIKEWIKELKSEN